MKLRRPLFRKYLRVLTGMIAGTLIIASLVQMTLSAQAQRARVDELLVAQSQLATVQIETFLGSIIDSLSWALDYDQPGSAADHAAIRDTSHRLLRKVPPLTQLRFVGKDGCVVMEVARVGVDRGGACDSFPLLADEKALLQSARGKRAAFGRVFFRDGSAPYVDIAVAARGRDGGFVLAQVDLRQIHTTINAIRVGASGFAYIVDRDAQLIAHPDPNLVLRNLDLKGSPPVAAAFAGNGAPRPAMLQDLEGRDVVSVAALVRGPNWWLFIQQPAREAFEPILVSLGATLVVVLAALAAAAAASYVLARRMASPILAVRAGAQRIAGGDLQTRIVVETGDEVEFLAHEFNRMAEALGDSYAQLEAKVMQRTEALAQVGAKVRRQADELAFVNDELNVRLDELALRKDEAERASAAKTRFLAAASHDLMQPMHAVGLMVGILEARIRSGEESALIGKVQAAVHSMESLFSGLLDISKLDSQSVKVELRPVRLQDLFDFVGTNFGPLASEKGIGLRVAPCRRAVLSDPVLLERILGNLVTNAIRYTAAGKVLVGCRRAGDTILLRVRDTGIGIAAGFQTQIFEEFFQIAPHGRNGSQGGLGLGLSIVKRSADLLGISMRLESVPGRGSLFELALPLLPLFAAGAPGAPALAANAGAAQHAQRLQGAFIVVVDDDQDALYAMEQLFTMAGCHVVAGVSSGALRAQLRGHLRTPDLIVTDWRLGTGDNGLHVIEGIRRDCEQMIPALIVTGESAQPGAAALPAHCLLLRKPIGPARLFDACAGLLAAQPTEQNSDQACLLL
ncbi:MAG: ATP-binding protein [Pseudomonadota bacterium]